MVRSPPMYRNDVRYARTALQMNNGVCILMLDALAAGSIFQSCTQSVFISVLTLFCALKCVT